MEFRSQLIIKYDKIMIKNLGMVSFVLRDFSYSGELILVRKSFKLQAARNFGYRLLGFACPPRPFLDGRRGNPSTFLCHYDGQVGDRESAK